MHPVPEAVDREVARLKLESLGVEIDALTAEQARYLRGWRGTGSRADERRRAFAAASVEKMRREGVPDAAIATFGHYYEQLEAGETGMVPEDRSSRCATCPTPRLPDGDAPLDQAVVIKLNGGLGTSMGMTAPSRCWRSRTACRSST